MDSDSTERVLQNAVRALARRAHSRGELKDKLLRKVTDEEQVGEVLRRLEELNLLNDGQFAYNFALWRMRQDGWGPAKAVHGLLRRGVDPRLAKEAVERVRHELGDACLLEDYLKKYTCRHVVPTDRKSIQKLIARLQRRGFQEDIIYGVLRQVLPPEAWQRFDRGE